MTKNVPNTFTGKTRLGDLIVGSSYEVPGIRTREVIRQGAGI